MPFSVSCARGLLCGFSDRLMLSHLYTEACFPIKSLWLPLSLQCVCAAYCGRERVCAYILYVRLWRDIEKAPRGTPPSITSSGRKFREARRTEEEMEVATGSSIWRNEVNERKVAEWMEQPLMMELVLIEPGSLYSLEIRMRKQC